MQSSKIPYEGPTQYEILHLLSRYNAAHHEVDHINTVGLTDLDIAKIESLASLDANRFLKNRNVDFQLDGLIKLIHEIKQTNTQQDWDCIDWEKVATGTKLLNKLVDAAAKREEELLDQAERRVREREKERERAAEERRQAEKQMHQAATKRDAERLIRKTQSNAELGRQAGQRYQAAPARQAERRNQEQRENTAPITPARPQTPGNGARPPIPGPGKLQKPNPNFPTPTKGTLYQWLDRLQTPNDENRPKTPGHQQPVHVIQTRPKSPAHHHQHTLDHHHHEHTHQHTHEHTPDHHHHQQTPGHHHYHTLNTQNRPKSPVQQQPVNIPNAKRGTVYLQPVKPNKPVNQNRPKSPAPQQPVRPNTPGNLNRQKSTGNLKQPAAVNPHHNIDPTKDPWNKAMFNKRPRIATEIKDLRAQKAHDEAKALASEVRKMD